MANIMKNRINTVLSQNALDKIKEALQTILDQLPEKGNITLEKEDRHTLASLDVDNKAFVEDAIAELTSRGKGIIPEFITPLMMMNDLGMYVQLDHILSDVNDLRQRIEDMRRIVASEGKGTADVVYGVFSTAADAGIPGAQAAYDKLKQRYKNTGAGAPAKPNP